MSDDRFELVISPTARIGPVLGRVPAQVMAEVDEALRLHLQP